MLQEIIENHKTTNGESPASGLPDGGVTSGKGFTFHWQKGPLGQGDSRTEPNGACIETIIAACIGRLSHFQQAADGRLACMSNHAAITSLKNALWHLEHRDDERKLRGVNGTDQP